MKQRLDDIEKIKTPYTVPENYFDQLQAKIQEKVSTPSPTFQVKWAWATVPAFIIILLSGVWLINNNMKTQTVSDMVAEIPEEEIMAYLTYNEITEQEILSLTDEAVLDDFGNLESIEIEDEELDGLLDSFGLDEIDINDI
ncbi:MAG: hypothetical protein RIC35_11540 [Marinoscillum sp.]